MAEKGEGRTPELRGFVRNAWYIAASADEIGDAPLARRFLGDPVVLFRDAAGKAVALEDRCRHRAAPLSLGTVTPRGIMCGYHGMVFAADGACVHIPGQSQIPPRARVRAYPLVERDEFVWIWMGDPERCSPDDILRFPHLPHAQGWPRAHGRLHVGGNYTLLVDNLMDLTHLAYLHKASIGGDADDHADAPMETRETATGVRFTRLIADTPPPPRYVEAFGFTGLIDRWEEFEFVAPACVLQSSGAADAGLGVIDRGLREGPHAALVLHALTPEDETNTHYFFFVATPEPAGPQASVDALFKVFAEDVRMIEQQQERLAGFDMRMLVDIHSDVARQRMTRTLRRLIEAEGRDEPPVAMPRRAEEPQLS